MGNGFAPTQLYSRPTISREADNHSPENDCSGDQTSNVFEFVMANLCLIGRRFCEFRKTITDVLKSRSLVLGISSMEDWKPIFSTNWIWIGIVTISSSSNWIVRIWGLFMLKPISHFIEFLLISSRNFVQSWSRVKISWSRVKIFRFLTVSVSSTFIAVTPRSSSILTHLLIIQ